MIRIWILSNFYCWFYPNVCSLYVRCIYCVCVCISLAHKSMTQEASIVNSETEPQNNGQISPAVVVVVFDCFGCFCCFFLHSTSPKFDLSMWFRLCISVFSFSFLPDTTSKVNPVANDNGKEDEKEKIRGRCEVKWMRRGKRVSHVEINR